MTLPLDDEDTQRLVDSWNPHWSTAPVPGPPSPAHARLELAHAVREGHRPGEPPPLAQDDPVPGCRCPRCDLLTRGASLREVEWVEDVLRDLARIDPSDRLRTAGLVLRAADDLPVPSAGWLCRRTPEVPDARGPHSRQRTEDPPRVEKVRYTSIIAVARRLNLDEPIPHGHQYRVRCPLHHDDQASLHWSRTAGVGTAGRAPSAETESTWSWPA